MIVNDRMKERLKSDFNEQVMEEQQKEEEEVVECFWYFVSLKDEMAAGCVGTGVHSLELWHIF